MPGGKHGQPSTGDGKKRSRPKIGKAEVNYVNKNGTSLLSQLARLWSGKPKK